MLSARLVPPSDDHYLATARRQRTGAGPPWRVMMNWLISLVLGVGVGIVYGLLGVRSPAPPVVALVGLLGMLGGEQLATLGRHYFMPPPPSARSDATPPSVGDGPG